MITKLLQVYRVWSYEVAVVVIVEQSILAMRFS